MPRTSCRPLAATVALLSVAASVAVSVPPATADTLPTGPDVSNWQHPYGAPIAWTRVKAAGSSFAIVKATEGASYTNSWLSTDLAGARAAHLVVGAYAYVRPALPMSTALAQADHFAAALGNQRTAGTLPPVLDLEESGGLSAADLTTWAQTFLEEVRAATGRTPVIYSYPYFWSTAMAGSTAFARYGLWLASYQSTVPYPLAGFPSWTFWQYSATSTVDGIPGPVDMSRFGGTATQLAAAADGTLATPWPLAAPAHPVRVGARAGNRSAVVSWQPSDDGGHVASSYTVTASPGGTAVRVSGTASLAVVSGLQPGRSYTFTVTATNPTGTSVASASSLAVVPGQVPTAPGTLTATPSSGAASLSWTASAGGATAYVVRRCSPAPCVPVNAVASVAAPATSFRQTGLVNGSSYGYSVVAANTWGASAPSNTATVRPVGPPPAPTSLTATAALTSLTLHWSPPATTGGASLARYLVSLDGAAPVAVGADIRQHTFDGLASGTAHRLSVAAVSSLGTGTAARLAASTLVALVPSVVVASTPAVTASGHPATLTGRVVRLDNHALMPGVPITVTFTPRAGSAPAPWQVVTDATGSALITLQPAVSGVVLLVVGASPSTTASSSGVALDVRASVSVALSTTAARVGQQVGVTGATTALLAGEHVIVQQYLAGAWHTVTSAVVGRDGRYVAAFAPTTTGSAPIRSWLRTSTLHVSGTSRVAALTVS